MKSTFLYICLLFSIYNTAQNLVPNSSFETYTTCPTNYGQINNSNNWLAVISSPDYFNACTTNTNVTVPKNFSGGNYQQAKSGNAYAGITTLGAFGNNMRENLGAQLISSLVNNSIYLVKFYIANMQCYKLANNNLALNFSSTLTTTVSAGSTVNLPMHIYKFGNPIIKDTLNWTEIIGLYKSNGTEQYITIGNFKDDANTKMDTTNYGSFGYASYYMIDDVSVESICTPFWSYRDTTVAIGDSVLIGPAITGLNINWYDATGTFITNAPGIYVKPNSPTFYTATEDFCGSIITHTINVGVSPVGIKEMGTEAGIMTLFPNPTNGILNVGISTTLNVTKMLNDKTQLRIKINDVLGRDIIYQDYQKEIDITVLQKGIYFLSLYNDKQLIITKKIVKE